MVESVVSDSNKIDVVRQANHETVPRRYRGNLEERDAGLQNPLSQHPDVNIERRDVCILNRLTGGKQEPDLMKRVIPKPDDGEVGRTDPETCDGRIRCDAGAAGTSLLKRK